MSHSLRIRPSVSPSVSPPIVARLPTDPPAPRGARGRLPAAAVLLGLAAAAFLPPPAAEARSFAVRARHGMVVSQNHLASEVGAAVLREGGNAMDAAVATAFALAVTHPTAGNIGGGGFLVYRPASGDPLAYDFREMAPAAATPDMWLVDGEYSFEVHHLSHRAVGVPGTVAGLRLAWEQQGSLPWERLVRPAVELARDGFPVSHGLAASLARVLDRMEKYPASVAQFSKTGTPYEPGEVLRQPDLAASLERILERGAAGFYEGETADLLVAEMEAGGGLITHEDLLAYEAKVREPVRGEYRGHEIISMPPPSSGGTALVQMLNILEGYDLADSGFGSAETLHFMAEAMRRAFADRALHLGDPDFNPAIPIDRLTSKPYANELRATITPETASVSSPESFEWPTESEETTHFSVVDSERNAVSLTYTLEFGYGSGIVVPGGGFLLNNEMGDFNAAPGLTDERGLIGTDPNLAEGRKRMLSSMTPTIVAKDGDLFLVTGTPGGRTIINTVLQTIVNVVDHGMNAQEAVDAGRIHHQWLPDRINHERQEFSPDTLSLLERYGHTLNETRAQGAAEVILHRADEGVLEGGVDRRAPDGGAGVHDEGFATAAAAVDAEAANADAAEESGADFCGEPPEAPAETSAAGESAAGPEAFALFAEQETVSTDSSALSSAYNFVEISDSLSTAGQITNEEIAAAGEAGFDVVVNLAPARRDRNLEEGFRVTEAGMTYVQIPVDWQAPALRDLELFFDVMDANRDRRVFVHCFANMRVSVFVYLYRTLRQGVPEEDAWDEVLEVWDPGADPETAQWPVFIERAKRAHASG